MAANAGRKQVGTKKNYNRVTFDTGKPDQLSLSTIRPPSPKIHQITQQYYEFLVIKKSIQRTTDPHVASEFRRLRYLTGVCACVWKLIGCIFSKDFFIVVLTVFSNFVQ